VSIFSSLKYSDALARDSRVRHARRLDVSSMAEVNFSHTRTHVELTRGCQARNVIFAGGEGTDESTENLEVCQFARRLNGREEDFAPPEFPDFTSVSRASAKLNYRVLEGYKSHRRRENTKRGTMSEWGNLQQSENTRGVPRDILSENWRISPNEIILPDAVS